MVSCVVQMINRDGVSVQARSYMQLIGWQNTWEQAPGAPATPEPSMTKCSCFVVVLLCCGCCCVVVSCVVRGAWVVICACCVLRGS